MKRVTVNAAVGFALATVAWLAFIGAVFHAGFAVHALLTGAPP